MSQNLTVVQQLHQDALKMAHKPINDQLAALRATRGTREVGTLKVPTHLVQAEVTIIAAPESTDPRACRVCGRGLTLRDNANARVCNSCADNPSTDMGVEARGSAASVLPAVGL
jgi:hypothetical protein